MSNELDNKLVKQKNGFLLIANAQDLGDHIGLAGLLTDDLKLWCMNAYHYKGVEICDAVLQSLMAAEQRMKKLVKLRAVNEVRKIFTALRARFSKAHQCWERKEDYCFQGECAPAGWKIV